MPVLPGLSTDIGSAADCDGASGVRILLAIWKTVSTAPRSNRLAL